MVEIDEDFKKAMLNRDEKLEKFDKFGITEDYLIGKLKEELEASTEGQKKVKIPLWKIRQDARKDAHKLKGDYPAEKHEHSGNVIFHSNVPEPDMPKDVQEGKTLPPEEEEKISVPKDSPAVKTLTEQMKDHHNEPEEETLYVTPQKK